MDAWPHLGHELNRFDLSRPYNCSLDEDALLKMRKFIGKRSERPPQCTQLSLILVEIGVLSFQMSRIIQPAHYISTSILACLNKFEFTFPSSIIELETISKGAF